MADETICSENTQEQENKDDISLPAQAAVESQDDSNADHSDTRGDTVIDSEEEEGGAVDARRRRKKDSESESDGEKSTNEQLYEDISDGSMKDESEDLYEDVSDGTLEDTRIYSEASEPSHTEGGEDEVNDEAPPRGNEGGEGDGEAPPRDEGDDEAPPRDEGDGEAPPRDEGAEGDDEGGEDEALPTDEEDGLPKDSPMFVPRGPYFHHDNRGDSEDDNKEERPQVPLSRSEVADKWEHDMYDPELQKPREQWEKDRDRKHYDELDRRRAEREARGEGGGRGGRAQRPTHFGQYMPRRDDRNRTRPRDNRKHEKNQGERESGDHERNRRPRENRNRDQQRSEDTHRGERRNDDRRYGGQRQRSNREKNTDRGGSGRSERGSGWGEHRNDRTRGGRDREDKRVTGPNQSEKRTDSKPEDWDEEKQDTNRHENESKEPDNDTLPNEGSPPVSKEHSSVSKDKPPRDHSKSLFSKETFTSKVFSLSSQDNSLIVKPVDSVATRRVFGRGRGRGRDKPNPDNNATPGKIASTKTHSTSSVDTDDITVISPLEERINHKDTRQDNSVEASSSPDKKEVETVGEDAGNVTSKPKRYSSRRQQNKTADSEPVVEDGEPGLPEVAQPMGRPYPWSYPVPMMPGMDPALYEQQMALIMQNPVVYQQQQMMMQQQMRLMYPPPLPPGVDPYRPPYPSPLDIKHIDNMYTTHRHKPSQAIPIVPPDQPLVMPDQPIVAPDQPIVALDQPIVAPDQPIVTPDQSTDINNK